MNRRVYGSTTKSEWKKIAIHIHKQHIYRNLSGGKGTHTERTGDREVDEHYEQEQAKRLEKIMDNRNVATDSSAYLIHYRINLNWCEE